MFLNQYEMQRYIRASAKRGNLLVEWREGQTVPCTNGGTIILPKLSADATEREYRQLLHYATHESDHVLYSDFDAFKKTGVTADKSLLGFIWNLLEDHRIEWLGTREYEGDRQNTDSVYADLWRGGVKNMKDVSQDPTRSELSDHLTPLMSFMNRTFGDIYPNASLVQPSIDAIHSPKAKVFLDKLNDGDYHEVLRNIRDIEDREKGTAATFELAKRIFEEVYEQDAEEELKNMQPQPQQQQQQQQGGGEDEGGEGGEGEGKEGQPGEDEGKGEGKQDSKGKADESGDGEGEKQQQSRRKKLMTVNYEEYMPNPHKMADPKHRPAQAGLHIDYSAYSGSGSYLPATEDEVAVSDMVRKQYTHTTLSPGSSAFAYHDHSREYAHAKTTKSQGFASRVRTRLQIRSRARYEYGTKKGKLHQPQLYRATLVDCPGINERVFKRRIESDTLNTCVQVVVDTSGSMSGFKYAHAMVSAHLLNDAIGNVLNIPLEILGFTDGRFDRTRVGSYYSQPAMFVHRDFNTRRLSEEELVERMEHAGNYMNGNPDGDAIAWAYARIRQRREKRKVMIVLSDGQPATSRLGDIRWYTKEVVKRITAEKRVEIVGIGIMDDNVEDIYPEHYVIKSADQLETALLSLIDRKVR